MTFAPTTLRRQGSDENIPAELHDMLPLDAFFEAEEIWAPERVRILKEFVLKKLPGSLPESIHWNWSKKTLNLRSMPWGAFSPYRLFGIKAEGVWQALLVGCCVGRTSRVHLEKRDIVYVDMLEVAPWNWVIEPMGRLPKFRGCGRQLVELAVRWSDDLGFKGRVGLHSLPQSDSFYRDRCHMKDLGPDPDPKYQSMRYFELLDSAATTHFLSEDN